MFEKCTLTILELNWNQRLGHFLKTKLSICHHMLTSSTQLQKRSFHVVERTRTSSKCQKKKNARARSAKILFFIVKYANLWGFCCRRRRGCSLIRILDNWPLRTSLLICWLLAKATTTRTLQICIFNRWFLHAPRALHIPFSLHYILFCLLLWKKRREMTKFEILWKGSANDD